MPGLAMSRIVEARVQLPEASPAQRSSLEFQSGSELSCSAKCPSNMPRVQAGDTHVVPHILFLTSVGRPCAFALDIRVQQPARACAQTSKRVVCREPRNGMVLAPGLSPVLQQPGEDKGACIAIPPGSLDGWILSAGGTPGTSQALKPGE